MNHRDAFYLRLGLIIVAVSCLCGIVLLLTNRDFRDPATSFELLVFMMSTVALTLAIVQGIAIERQMREIKKSSTKISDAAHELSKLVAVERRQSKLIHDDLELDTLFLEFLDTYGLELDARERKELAKLLKRVPKVVAVTGALC